MLMAVVSHAINLNYVTSFINLEKSRSPPKNEEQRCIKCNGKILTSSYNGICTICYKSSRYF